MSGRKALETLVFSGVVSITFLLTGATSVATSVVHKHSEVNTGEKTFVAVQDATVSSGFPDSALGNSIGLLVGRSNRSGSPIYPFQVTQTFLQFDASELEDADIVEAHLRLYPVYTEFTGANPSSVDIAVWSVTQGWAEPTVKWSNKPPTSANPVTNADVSADINTWVDILIPIAVVQQWVDQPQQNHGLLLSVPSVESSGGQLRNFRSRENGTGEYAPQLVVTYQLDAPPTLTPTPTPTPGIKLVSFQSQPTGEIAPGAIVSYAIGIENGPYVLSGLVVTTTAPGELTIVSDTVENGTLPWQHQIQGQRIIWTLNQGFPPDAVDQLNYQAVRPTQIPTVTPNTLAITKDGPKIVLSGEVITYTLRVYNQTPYTLTDITITDTLPVSLNIVESGGAFTTTMASHLVWQETTPLASGAILTRTFSGRPIVAATQIVNDDYQVRAVVSISDTQESITALGAVSVTTIVTTTPSAIFPPTIVNTGACVRWNYAVTGEPFQSGIQCSGPAFNPYRSHWLPYLAR